MIESFAPGKLYLAGEYAVVESGYPAILIAIDKFIKVSLQEAKNKGSISFYKNDKVSFIRKGSKLILDKEDNRLSYIMSSIRVVEDYAREKGIELKLYHLKVESELITEQGEKYGLGSSAAVTVATIKALCKFYNLKIDNLSLFKLAAIAQLKINTNGSCGDIAASVYTGWISYRSFDRKSIIDKIKTESLSELLNSKWKNLKIERLYPPEELKLLIGWTGKPASTTKLVDKVEVKRERRGASYSKFLRESKVCVEKMITAFKTKNYSGIADMLEKNRQILMEMSEELEVLIETDKLEDFYKIIKKNGGVGKTSGAGGGDCGISIFSNVHKKDRAIKDLEEADILYLPLKVYEIGDDDDK